MSTVKSISPFWQEESICVYERFMKIITKIFVHFGLCSSFCVIFTKCIESSCRFCEILIDQSVKFVKAVTTVYLSSVIKKP